MYRLMLPCLPLLLAPSIGPSRAREHSRLVADAALPDHVDKAAPPVDVPEDGPRRVRLVVEDDLGQVVRVLCPLAGPDAGPRHGLDDPGPVRPQQPVLVVAPRVCPIVSPHRLESERRPTFENGQVLLDHRLFEQRDGVAQAEELAPVGKDEALEKVVATEEPGDAHDQLELVQVSVARAEARRRVLVRCGSVSLHSDRRLDGPSPNASVQPFHM